MQNSTPSSGPSTRPSIIALDSKLPLPKRPNKGISDAQRKALRAFACESPPPTHRACVEWFRDKFGRIIDRTTVSRVLSSRYDYLDYGAASNMTRKSSAHWPILDEALFEWQNRLVEQGQSITGPLIRMKAIQLWKQIDAYKHLPQPIFSDGWLTGFKKRYSISWHTFHGEAASVPESIHTQMKAIQAICDQYEPDNIYNMDETGLFWRLMPNGSLASKGQAGQKKDKTRITVVAACNATGTDRLPLWVIGSAQTPRALRGVNMASIGCVWKWNDTAWMRSDIMVQWLRTFYLRIGRQRRTLLLLDNFPVHVAAVRIAPPSPNIEVVFFPANATSIYQPLDQGIINNLKHHYRKKWMVWMINMLDRGIDPRERMNLNHALRWLCTAWKASVSDDTIRNCFRKSTVLHDGQPRYDETPPATPVYTEDSELRPLYNEVSIKLVNQADAQVILPYEAFINPPGENIDTGPLDLSDIILNAGDGSNALAEEDDIYGPPLLDIPTDTLIKGHLDDLSIWAANREGVSEEDMSYVEALMKLHARLQINGRKQKTLEEMGFKPK